MNINYINNIIDCEIFDIGRASDMCWIIFTSGDSQEYYSLHLQCPWRIRKENNILLSNLDIYELSMDYGEECEWDDKKKNVFDEIIIQQDKWKDKKVEKIIVTEVYDLKIILSDIIVIECFVNHSRDECWRFFKKGGKEHLTITGAGIEDC